MTHKKNLGLSTPNKDYNSLWPRQEVEWDQPASKRSKCHVPQRSSRYCNCSLCQHPCSLVHFHWHLYTPHSHTWVQCSGLTVITPITNRSRFDAQTGHVLTTLTKFITYCKFRSTQLLTTRETENGLVASSWWHSVTDVDGGVFVATCRVKYSLLRATNGFIMSSSTKKLSKITCRILETLNHRPFTPYM